MATLAFKQLPLAVKVSLWLVFNNAWWSIEEFVIDRHNIWRYMPHYKVADPCVWDLGVAVISALLILYASVRRVSAGVNPL